MLQGEIALQMLRNFRVATLTGRWGGGKTSLCVRLAFEFVKRGWADHVVGNFPCVLFSNPREVKASRAVIILDEAGAFVNFKVFDELSAFLRKLECTVLMPSVLDPPGKARRLSIQRTSNLAGIGLPVWSYTVGLDYEQQKDRFKLRWSNPSEVFGLYSTSYVTDSDCGLVDWIGDEVERRRGETNEQDAFFFYPSASSKAAPGLRARVGSKGLDESGRQSEAFAQAARQAAEAVSLAARQSGKRRS